MTSKIVPLSSICRPRQWPTISGDQLTPTGYPVFGANGKTGFYSEYNHENPTLLITCRGATCGTMNICEPKSYVTGNSMALDDLNTEQVDMMYLYYYLKFRGFSDVISGSARPQITRQGLEKVVVPIIPIERQKMVAKKLGEVEGVQTKRGISISELDNYLRSLFIEMFGDPMTNPKNLPQRKLEDVCVKITDGEHQNPKFVENGRPIVMAQSVQGDGVTLDGTKMVSEEDFQKFTKKCKPEKGDVLLVSRGATIGRNCVVEIDDPFCLMGSVILIKPAHDRILGSYLSTLFKTDFFKSKLLTTSSASAQQAIYLKHLKDHAIPIPDLKTQKDFSKKYYEVLALQQILRKSEHEMAKLFNSLLAESFLNEATS